MSFVQPFHLAQDAGANSIVLVCAGLTVGNLVCGQVTWQSGGGGTAELTSITNATVVDKQIAGGFGQATFYATNVGSSLTFTANFSASLAFRRIQAFEYSGQDTSGAALNNHVQGASATFGTLTDACTSTAVVTTVDGCLIVGFAYDDTSATLPTAGTSFTPRDGFTNAAGDGMIGEDRVQAVQGSVAATFTTTAGTDQIFVSMLAFLPATVAVTGGLLMRGLG